MKNELILIKKTVKTDWQDWCTTFNGRDDFRYTIINPDGRVLCRTFDSKDADEELEAQLTLKNNYILKKSILISSLKKHLNEFDRALFFKILPLSLMSYLLFIFLFFRSTKPLGVILSKVEKFKDDIPFNRSLKLLYKRDEWGTIEEALNKADQRLQDQVQEAILENEKNTAILESINDDIIAIDRYETVLFYNSKFQKDFMHKRVGQEIDQKIWHIFSDEVLMAFRSVLSDGKVVSLKTMNFPLSHFPDRFYDLTITPLQTSGGLTTGALGVLYDVTEFKLTEQMRVDFVANVSHEIRTPLTSIKGFTQILQSQTDKVDKSLHPFMDKIVTNTERMISLFNDLLNLSVIESGNELRSEEFSLSEIVEEVEGNILASFPDKKIIFENDIQLKLITGDFRLIEQVILNLSDNACKYAEEKVKIKISSYEENHKAYISIEDDGPGIAKKHLPRIFERFYRIDASRESLRGTGLGLSIVKQIISKHKGRIWAESEGQGLGTKFIIELPLE
jgi:two-component system, OmpR family, phosphate regulon sensor histidine kinase PhoR